MNLDELQWVYHEDAERFRRALAYTEAVTGFAQHLIEKDYYCSILLQDLAPAFGQGLVFKGGTCLSKVYAQFYRLSEDLDFTLPCSTESRRSERRSRIAFLKDHLAGLHARRPCFRVVGPLGRRESREYVYQCVYRSLMTGRDQSIKLDLSQREPMVDPPEQRPASTILADPLRPETHLPEIPVSVLSLHETYAEKLRAALTRRPAAIRDFYDIDHAVRNNLVDLRDTRLAVLVRRKVTVPLCDPIDVSVERLDGVRKQLPTHLKSVLRQDDYDGFDLDAAIASVLQVANGLAVEENL